jgi:hypothetical protein
MESCSREFLCAVADRSTKKRRTTRSESRGGRANGSFPREMPLSHSVSPLPPREEWHVHVERGWNCFRQILCSGLRLLRWRCVSHYAFGALAAMHSGVACRAQRDQVFIRVGSRMAAELPVVHLKLRHRATGLTPPAVAIQDFLAQTFVRRGVRSQASGFCASHSQEAFSRRFSRKVCCCSPGKNL